MDEGLILETARLRLRQFRPEDVEALELVLGDPVAMRFYPAPYDRQGVAQWIERNIRRYEEDGCGLWAMVLKYSEELIGDCGCVYQHVDGSRHLEIGYHVRRDIWNQGYATEAARACMDYAFGRIGAQKVISLIKPENVNSRRVAEKNELTVEKMVLWFGNEHCMYARHREA